jgi:hypothetical protein
MRRETAYAALFARLEELSVGSGGPFVTVSRRYKTWEDTVPAEQPALYLTLGDQEVIQQRGLPPVWRLWASAWVYCRSEDPELAPAVQLNDLIDAVNDLLVQRDDEDPAEAGPFTAAGAFATTLGGAVSYARVGMPVVTDEGFEGDQGVARIHIEMLTVTQ